MPSITVELLTEELSFKSPYTCYPDEKPLGEGAVAQVYRGTSHDGLPIVIKMATNDTPEEDIVQEYDILKKLRAYVSSDIEQGDARLFPEATLGKYNGSRVLVMPLYQIRLIDMIHDFLAQKDVLAAETLAVSAAIQFTCAMEALHGALHQTCTDRKTSDFFLLDGKGQLVIIDWNVLREPTAAFYASEIRKFGDLWHEIFMNTASSPPLQPFDDSRWKSLLFSGEGGVISIGLRTILAEAVRPEEWQRFGQDMPGNAASQKALRETLLRWQALLESPAATSPASLPSALQLSPSEADAVLADLEWRKNPRSSTWQARVDALQKIEAERDFSQTINQALNRGDWDATAVIVKDTLSRTEDGIDRVHLRRWSELLSLPTLYKNAVGTNFQRAVDQELKRKLAEIGNLLHSDPEQDDSRLLQSTREALEDVKRLIGFDESVGQAIEPLFREVEVRRMGLQYRRSGHDYAPKYRLTENRELLKAVDSQVQHIPYLHDQNLQGVSAFAQRILDVEHEKAQLADADRIDEDTEQQKIQDYANQKVQNAIAHQIQDKNGEFTQEVEAIRQEWKQLDADLEARGQRLESLYESGTNTAMRQIGDVEQRIAHVQARLRAQEEIEKRLNEQSSRLDQLREQHNQLHDAIQPLNGDDGLLAQFAQLRQAQEQSEQFAEALVSLAGNFREGRINDLHRQIADLTRRYPASDWAIHDVLRSWTLRLHYHTHLEQHLKKVQEWLDNTPNIKPTPENWQTLSNVIQDLYSALHFCPADAFTERLYEQWLHVLKEVATRAKKLASQNRRIVEAPDPEYRFIQSQGRAKLVAHKQFFQSFVPPRHSS